MEERKREKKEDGKGYLRVNVALVGLDDDGSGALHEVARAEGEVLPDGIVLHAILAKEGAVHVAVVVRVRRRVIAA